MQVKGIKTRLSQLHLTLLVKLPNELTSQSLAANEERHLFWDTLNHTCTAEH